ncbi:dihydrolipoyl dehydrogenase family protein [Pseudonocardia pini]|uniref:dihydrolipoyl dehydrogenase family protein n=1 Tax=Pseudonocardia pini TaxID=2758030 RepID=UPI0015F0260C|nr:NAD(P)/FAD-dependent oxidoreductase [Pseudonocardia pini]
MTEYDVIVVGAGPVGENAADYAHRSGLSVALVEAERVGGECSYWACIPSKALLRTPDAVAAARRLPGVTASFDPKEVFARRDYFTSRGDDSSQAEWVSSAGITLVRGWGRLAGEKAVQVGEEVLRARHAVVLATGSVPVRPPIPGIDEVRTWGSREATSAEAAPRRLGVLGGGVVGCEMAQAYARLGSQVTMLVRGTLLPSVEPDAGERVAEGLRADGVDVRLQTGLDAVAPAGDAIALSVGGETIEVDELLLATGRRPNSADIGLDTVGLEPGSAVEIDDSGLALGDWLYATGDVTGRAPLTHMGKYQARIAGAAVAARAAGTPLDTAAWGEHSATADHVAVPQVVFTDPQVAHVGRTAAQAGDGVREVAIDIAVSGASLHADGYSGRAILVVDTAREVLVGATFVGQDVAELLHSATVAVVGEVPLSRLWHAVPSFPTISEVWLRLLEAYRA